MSAATEHVSALVQDELAISAIDQASREAAQAHLASCARCRADAEAAAEARAEFLRGGYARTRASATAARRRPAWPWLALPAIVAAAAVALLITRGAVDSDLLVKGGGPALRVFGNHAGEVFAVRDGTRLAAGDRIRFVIEPAGAAYVMVASIDGRGAATVYYPYGGEASARIPSDDRSELPGSIVLDEAPGPERVFAIFSDAPIAAAAVLAQLRQVGARGSAAIWTERELDGIPARAQLSVVFDKGTP